MLQNKAFVLVNVSLYFITLFFVLRELNVERERPGASTPLLNHTSVAGETVAFTQFQFRRSRIGLTLLHRDFSFLFVKRILNNYPAKLRGISPDTWPRRP